jgi:hypothetical protein
MPYDKLEGQVGMGTGQDMQPRQVGEGSGKLEMPEMAGWRDRVEWELSGRQPRQAGEEPDKLGKPHNRLERQVGMGTGQDRQPRAQDSMKSDRASCR